MMRALAESIMGGRWVAVVVAFIGLPLVSPAAVALVTLRKGPFSGLWVLASLVLPSVLLLAMGVVWWSYLLGTLLGSVLIYVAAIILREYRSWPLTLILVSVAATFGAYLIAWNVDLHADMMDMADYMKMGEIEKVDFEKAVNELLEQHVVAPGIALMVSLNVICSLILARWWQALLYNPGGFREEFHDLRMDIRMVGFTAILAFGLMQVPNATGGILIVMLPLLVTGLGYLHWWAERKRLAWLPWGVYLGLLLSLLVWTAVIIVGMLDSLFKLRNRVQKTN